MNFYTFLFLFIFLIYFYSIFQIKEKLKQNNILITGGCGFIGSHLVEYFENEKDIDYIYIIDDLSNGNINNIKSFKKVKLFISSIENEQIIEKVMSQQIKHVFHLASKISIIESLKDPIPYIKVNIIGTLLLLKYSKIYKIESFILSSSSSIYNQNKNPYSNSKLESEYYLFLYSNYFKTISLRYFNVYGERQSIIYQPIIPYLIIQSLKNENIQITGNGLQTRDFIYVKDIVNANIKSINELKNGIYDIGCGIETSIYNITKIILNLTLSKSKIIYIKERKGDIKNSKSNDYKCQYSMIESLKRTILFYQNQ